MPQSSVGAGPRLASESTKKPAPRMSTSAKSTHPSIAVMVSEALRALYDRRGTSLRAVKEFIADNYDLDVATTRLAKRIRLQIKSALDSGEVVQIRGVGCAGSFKLTQREPQKPNKKTTRKAEKTGSGASKETEKMVNRSTVKPKARAKVVEADSSEDKLRALKITAKVTKSPMGKKLPRPKKTVMATNRSKVKPGKQ